MGRPATARGEEGRRRWGRPRRWLALVGVCIAAAEAAAQPGTPIEQEPSPRPSYRILDLRAGAENPLDGLDAARLGLLEKLNRSDRAHLARQDRLAVPDRWDVDELAHSPLPSEYAWAVPFAKALVVHQPSQVFGAYERGRLVRWGPVSSGRRDTPTPQGLFHLTWKSKGRRSTVDPAWFMPWYFNFENRRGLSFHQYALPGRPASHACVRLLERDAKWLFGWGGTWRLDARGWTVLEPGTPVLIVGRYDYKAPPPWLSLEAIGRPIALPADPP